ncbi:competence protein CoiA family protein [Longispora albida]|uniref:competence protein CoiA family protein n=1 Tax=Longispora albida TaxID=203523 RepID=UPI0012FAED59|nr:competence protein CoiA family protein [Longispora albida]
MRATTVLGLDLSTGEEVHIDSANADTWRAKGHRRRSDGRGNETLVCLYCHHGDGVPAGTLVPLVVRSRLGGKRRPHFAHPPGHGPARGHAAETIWHFEGKHLLARWARTLPCVQSASTESPTPDSKRRSDVAVVFAGGARLALELQSRPVVDTDWINRHRDYQAAGITDVWLLPEGVGPPGVLLAEGVQTAYLDTSGSRIGFPVARPHDQAGTRSGTGHFARHAPPCPGDPIDIEWFPLAEADLQPSGLRLPEQLTSLLAAEHQQAQARAAAIQQHTRGIRQQQNNWRRRKNREAQPDGFPEAPTPAASGAGPSRRSTAVTRPELPPAYCDLCEEELGIYWRYFGRHQQCGMDRRRPVRPDEVR